MCVSAYEGHMSEDTRHRVSLETEDLGASQPVSNKLGPNPALSFQRLVSKAQLLTVYYIELHANTSSFTGTVS